MSGIKYVLNWLESKIVNDCKILLCWSKRLFAETELVKRIIVIIGMIVFFILKHGSESEVIIFLIMSLRTES